MNKSNRTLLLIVALLVSPVVIATGLYFSGWQPAAKANGELLQSPHAVATSIAPEAQAGRWLLVVAGAGPCDQQCLQLLDQSRRIQVALYKQMPRVARLWLSDDADAARTDTPRLKQMQPDLLTASVASTSRDDFDMNRPGHRIYLMDPQGKLVMRYRADAPTKGILADMQRLLRYS